jgi:hypothetical protein
MLANSDLFSQVYSKAIKSALMDYELYQKMIFNSIFIRYLIINQSQKMVY